MKKIVKRKYFQLVTSTVTALFMSFLMSGVIILINVWYSDNFISNWSNAWLTSFFVAWPVSLFVIPLVRKNIEKITY